MLRGGLPGQARHACTIRIRITDWLYDAAPATYVLRSHSSEISTAYRRYGNNIDGLISIIWYVNQRCCVQRRHPTPRTFGP